MNVTNHISKVLDIVLLLFHNGMSRWDIEPDGCEGGISAGEDLVTVFVINVTCILLLLLYLTGNKSVL
jgi:hypothetical protein